MLLDVHHVGGRATGNETWARQVACAVQADPSLAGADELTLAVAHADGSAMATRADVVEVGRRSASRLLWQLPAIVRRRGIDAVLVQYTAPLSSVPSVVAIHDLSFTDPASRSWIPARERARMNATIRWSARRAGRILALSDHTSIDLQERWGIDPARIVVAPPAVDAELAARLRRTSGPASSRSGATVLAVGNVLPRKNLVVAARAVAQLVARGVPATLRVVGSVPSAQSSLRRQLLDAGAGRVEITGYVSADQLVSEYQQADVLAFPSLYEGFGIPVLEAMAAGVPVVACDATALPQAVDGAGVLVDPHDPEAWADALERVIVDSQLAAELRQLGLARIGRLSWADTGRKALDALRTVAA